MTPERYRQIGEIFDAALEVDAERRAEFLNQACSGDAELRSEVESLMRSNEEAPDFIADPALTVAAELLAQIDADDLIGQTIARYKIVSLLGTGGMGRVYLAEDTSLGRRVALKFLPAFFTNDRNQVSRFRWEARAASALNHPNILTIYEIGRADGTDFMATEYVEGETLRARLTHGPFTIGDALDVAMQVANALIAAHRVGVVHRDIKPENIMIRLDGYVKILDFGLAKLTENLLSSQPGSSKVPISLAIRTKPGIVMGTADYMSPEQARGLPVDVRSDVWSLGVVIYEMVAGKRPFAAPTYSDTIVSILEREPAPLSRYVPEIPAELERIVMKALAKDAKGRYQTIKEMAIDLRELTFAAKADRPAQFAPGRYRAYDSPPDGQHVETREASARSSTPEGARSTSSVEYIVSEIKRHKRGAGFVGALLVLLVGGASYEGYRLLRPANLIGAPVRTSKAIGKSPLKLETLTATGQSRQVAISPDGNYVAYTRTVQGTTGIWLRQLTTNTNLEIVPPRSSIYTLGFASSGQYLYFVKSDGPTGPLRDRRGLYRVSLLGGVPTKIVDDVEGHFSISADDTRIAFIRQVINRDGQREYSLIIINSDGAGERKLLVETHPNDLNLPIWSPDGGAIICAYGNSDGGSQTVGIVEVTIGDGIKKELSPDRFFHINKMAWLPDKSGLIMSARKNLAHNNQLWRVSYPGMQISQITEDLSDYMDLSIAAKTGNAVASQETRISDIWVGPSSEPQNLKKITQAINSFCWTPNGQLVYTSTASGDKNLWIMQPDGTEQRQLTNESAVDIQPAVTPDNRYIVFGSNRTGSAQFWRMDIDGSNQIQLTSGASKGDPAISPDGKWVLYNTTDDWHLWKVAIDGGEPVRLTEYFASRPSVSPDGKMIVCLTRTESKREIVILPFEGGRPLKRFDFAGLPSRLQWAADGKALIYAIERDGVTALIKQSLAGGPPKEIATFGEDELFDFGYSSDDQLLAVARGAWHHDVVLIRDLNRY